MAYALRRLRDHVTLDRQGAYLAALFVSVQATAIWLARQLATAPAEMRPDVGGPEASTGEAAAAGAGWVGLEIGLAVGVLLGLAVYRRLPEWGQRLIKLNASAAVLLYLGGSWGRAGVLPAGMAMCLGILSLVIVTDALDVWWAVNNLLATVAAVVIGAYVAYVFGVAGLAVAAVGLTAYDHYFANKRDWMFDLAGLAISLRLPALVLKPPRLRYSWDDVLEDDRGDHSWAIGTGDLALSAAFAAAVATGPTVGPLTGGVLATAGVVAGTVVACFRLRYELLARGSGAGLPALTAGALAGFVFVQPVALLA